MGDVSVGLSALAAAAPTLVYVLFIWWIDRYEREPLWLVAVTFGYGAIGGVLLGLTLSLVMSDAVGGSPLTEAAFIAPVAEEPAKGLILFVLLFSKNFDNVTDGVVYGAAAGLGFAMTENFFYFVDAAESSGQAAWEQLIVSRAIFSAPMHTCATAMLGAMLGRYRYHSWTRQWLFAPVVGLLLAMGLHAAFNGALVAGAFARRVDVIQLGLALIPVATLALGIVTWLALRHEHKLLRKELGAEAAAGTIPESHVDILPFYFRRRRSGWLPPGVPRKRYVNAATLLAFRRNQAKRPGKVPAKIETEMMLLRREIREMLGRG